MSLTTELDLVRKRGDNYAFRFAVEENEAPMNFTGGTFKMTIDTRKDPPDASTNVFQINGAIVGAAADGVCEFIASEAQMNLSIKTYYYDVQMTKSGQVATILKGKLKIEQDITK